MRCCLGVIAVLGVLAAPPARAAEPKISIGAEAVVPLPAAAHYIRYVYFRPVDQAVAEVNPPRFSWSYNPQVDPEETRLWEFRFQVAGDEEFSVPLVDQRCEYNFYNALSPFEPGEYYWRVGYIDPEVPEEVGEWSAVRSFRIDPDTVRWDRSLLADWEYLRSKGHPRLLFTKETLPQVRAAIESDPASRELYGRIVHGREGGFLGADRAIETDWWADPSLPGRPQGLGPRLELVCCVAFAWQMTGQSKYIDARPQDVLVALARQYVEKGLDRRDNTRNDYAPENVLIGLAYDWLYEAMEPQQRKEVVRAVERNADWVFNHFWWRRVPGRSWNWERERGKGIEPSEGRHAVTDSSGAKLGGSHEAEVLNKCFFAILAAYDEPDVTWIPRLFEVGMNYYIAHPYPLGSDEGYNEGAGYITSVLPQIAEVAIVAAGAFPELQLQKNPHFRSISRFMRYLLPVGLRNTPWGHGLADASRYAVYGRLLAHLADDGAALAHWQATTGGRPRANNIFVETCLPGVLPAPEPKLEQRRAALFPTEGWAMAHSRPPSAADAVLDGVGMVFQCRPRGGCYSHSLPSDLSFQLYAYGQSISHASGNMWNKPYSNHALSHNSILVDGMGQAQDGYRGRSTFGRIVAFEDTEDCVYVAGDATYCYPHEKFVVAGWWGRLDRDVYGQRDVSYLRRLRRHMLFVRDAYFVIFDELRTAPDHPAKFTWLYHIVEDTLRAKPDDPLAFRFRCGQVNVDLVHVAFPDRLEVMDRKDREGYDNPLTGESYRGRDDVPEGAIIPAHHLWISNRQKTSDFHFMTVIYPSRAEKPVPEIRRLDDRTVEVICDSRRDVVSFDADSKYDPTIVVDLKAIEARDDELTARDEAE